ncbi:MAG: beta strand repeat-containing protein, partial [Bacteroidota bacterium]
VTISATGGTAPYTGTGTISNLTAGTYSYTVTDANNCTSTVTVTITQPAAALVASSTSGSILCNGGSTTVTVSATGGTAPYAGTGSFTVTAGTYSYTVTDANGCTSVTSITVSQPTALVASSTSGSILCNGGTTTVTVSASGGTGSYTGTGTFTVSAGAYSYTVTDANGCTAITSGNVSQPAALVASSSQTNVSCFGGSNGSVTISATGGVAPYSGIGTFSGLSAGTYSYTVTDANNCTSTVTVTITQPTAALVASSTSGSILCNGGTTTVTVSATGGTAPYAGTGSFTVTAGTYSYTVTDNNGCTSVTSITVGQPTALIASSTSGSILCNGGTTSVTVSANGGTAPYTGTGSFTVTAGTYSYTVTDANGCTSVTSITVGQPTALVAAIATQTNVSCFGGSNGSVTITATGGTGLYTGTGTFTGLSAGTFSYTVSDANGCTSVVNVTITQPTQLVAATSVVNVTCNGLSNGSVTVSATGGTAPYTGTGTFSNLAAGTYNYTVSDANGCSTTISVTVTQPAVLVASSTSTNVTCNGGSNGTVTVTATGGTTPYSGTGTFTGLSAGTYTYTVTDAKGCTSSTTRTITQPALAVGNVTATACNSYTWNGTTYTTSGIYTFMSQTAAGCDSVTTLFLTIKYSTSSTSTVSSCGPYTWNGTTYNTSGTYVFNTTNVAGCDSTATLNLTVNTVPNAIITASGPTAFCQGGSVTLTSSTAGAGGSYLWSNGATTQSIVVTTSGTFTVTVTTAAGCSATSLAATTTVTPFVNASVTISSSASGVVTPTTSITFTATPVGGGSTPSYQWKLNGANVGTNSATYTNASWVNGDAVTVVMTSSAPCVNGSPATSNTISISVQNANAKYLVVDVTSNRAYYYDANWAFIQSSPMSTTVINGTTNAEDVVATGGAVYVLDGTNSRVYRSTSAGSASVQTKTLRTTGGQNLSNRLKGMAIKGDSLYIADQQTRNIYRYSLATAFNGVGTTLNAAQAIALPTAIGNAEALVVDNNYIYVLNNGTTKNFYRYTFAGAAFGSASRPLRTNTGGALTKVTGAVLDGTTMWVTDNGIDRSLSYDFSVLFSGTTNLNASTINVLNSGNLNATGITLVNTTSLIRSTEDGSTTPSVSTTSEE